MKNLGLGKETKSKILWRHVILLIAFAVCNFFMIYVVNVKPEPGSDQPTDKDSWYVKLM